VVPAPRGRTTCGVPASSVPASRRRDLAGAGRFGPAPKLPASLLTTRALSSSGAGNRHKPLLTARCALVQIADEADDVGQRAADPVEFPHDQRVALPRHLKRLRQARAVGCAARADVAVDPLAPRANARDQPLKAALKRGAGYLPVIGERKSSLLTYGAYPEAALEPSYCSRRPVC
jgi:hypothetical protein